MLKLIIPAALAIVILLGAMVKHRAMTGTGEGDERLIAFTTAVQNSIPKTIGEWTSEDRPLTEAEFKATNCTAYVSREYTNTRTGRIVSVYLVTGTQRHIVIHTPDKCYRGAGFTMVGGMKRHLSQIPPNDNSAEFTTSIFTRPDVDGPAQLRIFWTYSYDGKWEAPSNPKVHFAWKSALCKVYFIANEPTESIQDFSDETIEDTAQMEFAKLFLPAVTQELFKNLESPSSADSTLAAK